MIDVDRNWRGTRTNGHDDPLDHHRRHYCITIEEEPSGPLKSLPVDVDAEGLNYIEHIVSKFDTLAGIAIKYGVEVADIKKMNGLVTDHQMFALKTLHIPLPGRHPPSRFLATGLDDHQGPSSSEQTTPSHRHSDLFNSFQSLKLKPSPQPEASQFMPTSQGYYGLKLVEQKIPSKGFEIVMYHKGGAQYLDDKPFPMFSPPLNPPLSHKRRPKSVAHGLSENDDLTNEEIRVDDMYKWVSKLMRRPKSEVGLSDYTPEMLLKEDTNSGSAFSAFAGKGLALRLKATSRNISGADAEVGRLNVVSTGVGDSFTANTFSVVRRSSSTSNLQNSDNSSIRSTLMPDLQAISAAAITRPIFDGLSKPITGRKIKAALD